MTDLKSPTNDLDLVITAGEHASRRGDSEDPLVVAFAELARSAMRTARKAPDGDTPEGELDHARRVSAL